MTATASFISYDTEPLFDVVSPVDVVGAAGNRPRGHIALGPAEGPPTVTFCDVGPVLHVWAYTAGDLTPDAARRLAAELTAWADRKRGAA